MQNPHNRNNPTLFNIPDCIWNPDFIGKPDYTCWRVHTWIRDDRFLPAYHIWIKYNFYPDERGLMRAKVKNIWSRSDRLEIWCNGVLLDGNELKQAKSEIRNRMLRMFGWLSLRNKFVYCYRFNYIASFPEASLEDLDCHHEGGDNASMRAICQEYGMDVREEWFGATDDRVDRSGLMNRSEHIKLHHALGDRKAYSFNNRNNFDICNDRNEVCIAESEAQNGRDENEVNYGNDWVSDFLNYQKMRELWDLYVELGFDKDDQCRYGDYSLHRGEGC